jgi:hypothetical protein
MAQTMREHYREYRLLIKCKTGFEMATKVHGLVRNASAPKAVLWKTRVRKSIEIVVPKLVPSKG